VSSVPRSRADVDDLPSHLKRVAAQSRRAGRIKCCECDHWITIGPNGTEFGHSRYGRRERSLEGRCPHRPDDVDPQPFNDAASLSVLPPRDDGGRFQASE